MRKMNEALIWILFACLLAEFSLSEQANSNEEPTINMTVTEVVWTNSMSTLLTHEDRRIIDDRRISLERPYSNDWNIHIRDVKMSDQGRYTCHINTNPVTTTQVTLIVKAKNNEEPTINMTVTEVTTVVGETAVLPCHVLNLDDYKVVWTDKMDTLLTLEDSRIIDDGRISLERPYSNDWNIHIRDVKISDQGRYTCQINTNPVTTSQVTLIVKDNKEEPALKTQQIEITVISGKEAVLPCQVKNLGFGKSVAWKTNGRDNPLSIGALVFVDDPRIHVKISNLEVWNLHIRDVNLSDEGVYTCQTSTDKEIQVIQRVSLIVKDNKDELALKPQRTELTVIRGREAVLPCRVKNLDIGRTVVWKTNGLKYLSKGENIFVDDPRILVNITNWGDCNLHIRNVNEYDEGLYTCQTSTDRVIHVIKRVSLIVKEPPMILDGSTYEVVKEGDNVQLWCNVTGRPQPTVIWYNAADDITRSIKQVGNGNVLEMYNVTREEDGRYECVAENGIPPNATKIMYVSVNYKPKVSIMTRRLSQKRGKKTIFECLVEASPSPIIHWEKGGRQIISSERHSLGDEKHGSNNYRYTLSISAIDEDDFGIYICFAINDLGSDQANLMLIEFMNHDKDTTKPATNSNRGQSTTPTNPKTKATSTQTLDINDPPRILAASKYEVVTEGSNVQLWCNVTGRPKSTITWFREDESTRIRKHVGDRNMLEVFNVTREEGGRYECVADNGIPPNVTRIMYVSVNYKPKVSKVARKLSPKPGQVRIFECQVVASPFGIILWKKDGREITTDEKYSLELVKESPDTRLLRLRISYKEKEDFGVYTCFSNNYLGSDQANITLTELVDQEKKIPKTATTANTKNIQMITPGTKRLQQKESPASYVRIIDHTDDVTIDLGDDVTLWCEAEGVQTPNITWFILSKDIKNNKTELKTGSSILNIHNVTENQEYECVATVPDGESDNRFIRLIVEYPPKVQIIYNNSVHSMVMSGTVDCFITGNPLQFYAWSRNGEMIRSDGNYTITECKTGDSSLKYSLVLNNPNYDEGRSFTCEAINTHGRAVAIVTLPDEAIFALDVHPAIPAVIEKTPITLFCDARGAKYVSFTWKRKGKIIPKSNRRYMIKSTTTGSALRIQSTRSKKDNGTTFTCIGNDGQFDRRVSVNLTVYKETLDVDSIGLPKIKINPNYREVEEGMTVSLECEVESLKAPESLRVFWLKDGVPTIPDGDRISQDIRGSFVKCNV